MTAPVALLDELYVAPEVRGRGLGSALLAAAEALTRQGGEQLLEINLDGDDTGTRRVYERHGYVNSEPGEDRPLLYYYRELGDATSQREVSWPSLDIRGLTYLGCVAVESIGGASIHDGGGAADGEARP